MVQIDDLSLRDMAKPGAVRHPLYQFIVADVIEKIRNGEYAAGDQLASVGALCHHYDVAPATAHRSVRLLDRLGVVRTVPRKGVYIVGVPSPPAVKASPQVQRVILVDSIANRRSRKSETTASRGFSDGTAEAIVRYCRQNSMSLEFQFIPTDASAAPRIYFTPRSGDAIIAIGAGVSAALLSHMATPNVPSVLIDAAAPNAHCVLTDNYEGMYQVITHLHERGHRNVALGYCFETRAANSTNENERREGFLHHARVAGMRTTVIDSGEWDDLFVMLDGPAAPTAVVFTRDVAAVEFINRARKRGLDVPGDISVIGFDDWAQDATVMQELTTVHVEIEKLGEAAVEMVMNPPSNRSRLFHWRRVRPSFISRSSVANLISSSSESPR